MEFSVEIVKIKIQVILEGLKNLKKITKFFFNLIRKVNLSKEGSKEGRKRAWQYHGGPTLTFRIKVYEYEAPADIS